jgi:hypothetical protein
MTIDKNIIKSYEASIGKGKSFAVLGYKDSITRVCELIRGEMGAQVLPLYVRTAQMPEVVSDWYVPNPVAQAFASVWAKGQEK